MVIDFLLPFIILSISIAWATGNRSVCKSRYDYVYFYTTVGWDILFSQMVLSILAAIIIVWVKVGFLIALAYFGIAIGAFLISSALIIPILIKIFGYDRIGAILPFICGIGSMIWMFTQTGTL